MVARMRTSWAIAMACMAGTTILDVSPATSASSQERLVHRFLQVEISPDGTFVASVEGDSPVNGYYPALRQLVIHRVTSGAETRIALPCGEVPQCWPGFPTRQAQL
jgi:hypothetical protein